MPRINFDDVDDAVTLIPEGTYLCAVSEVKLDFSQKCGDYWRVVWRVLEGHEKGSKFEDAVFFTEKALSRVKLLCSKLGLPTTGTWDLQPKHLLGRKAKVSVEHVEETYQGKIYKKAKVPFGGYESVDGMVPVEVKELKEAEAESAVVPDKDAAWAGPAEEIPF